jgi:hypothetical protein
MSVDSSNLERQCLYRYEAVEYSVPMAMEVEFRVQVELQVQVPGQVPVPRLSFPSLSVQSPDVRVPRLRSQFPKPLDSMAAQTVAALPAQ